MKDGIVLKAEPESIVGHVSVPFWRWYENLGYA
jgi:hypothetical protein